MQLSTWLALTNEVLVEMMQTETRKVPAVDRLVLSHKEQRHRIAPNRNTPERVKDGCFKPLNTIQEPHTERHLKAECPLQMLTNVPNGGQLPVRKKMFLSYSHHDFSWMGGTHLKKQNAPCQSGLRAIFFHQSYSSLPWGTMVGLRKFNSS